MTATYAGQGVSASFGRFRHALGSIRPRERKKRPITVTNPGIGKVRTWLSQSYGTPWHREKGAIAPSIVISRVMGSSFRHDPCVEGLHLISFLKTQRTSSFNHTSNFILQGGTYICLPEPRYTSSDCPYTLHTFGLSTQPILPPSPLTFLSISSTSLPPTND